MCNFRIILHLQSPSVRFIDIYPIQFLDYSDDEEERKAKSKHKARERKEHFTQLDRTDGSVQDGCSSKKIRTPTQNSGQPVQDGNLSHKNSTQEPMFSQQNVRYVYYIIDCLSEVISYFSSYLPVCFIL